MNCAGNAYQEPLQLLNAEFAWNASQARVPRTYAACARSYEALRDHPAHPARVFGTNGFLALACERLYGKRAGRSMQKVFSLATSDGLPPVAHIMSKSYGAFGNPSAQPFFTSYWGDNLPAAKAAELARRWGRVKTTSLKAHASASTALRQIATPQRRSDVKWLVESFEIGSLCAEAAVRYFTLYAAAQRWLDNKSGAGLSELERARRDIEQLARRIRTLLNRHFPGKMLDYLDGDRRPASRVVEFLLSEPREIVQGARTGKRGPKSQRTWW